jgi:apolipoprotein N-acyltransferase
VVFHAGRIRASTIICVEAAFAGTVREDRLRGAEVILNLSNDAWLNGTIGPWQGPAHLVLRAIENRVGIIRASNTGPSQFIRPDGTVEASTSYGVQTALTAAVWASSEQTLFTRVGDWAGPFSVIWSVLLSACAAWPRTRFAFAAGAFRSSSALP